MNTDVGRETETLRQLETCKESNDAYKNRTTCCAKNNLQTVGVGKFMV